MPDKKRYQRIKSNAAKCPACSRSKPKDGFVTCELCRNKHQEQKAVKQLRQDAMSLFGIKK